ncbi:hypothetical protein CJF42_25155 [Pseudoalteromonas sp. NBT06-2]|uniref:hypothetical protein n=1 Tax=Pseudoalteromonas sp. NBT06-2 TaxID=2025950 RepID=UPI000BA6F0AE|nr:hypothetical protein [Pseudoalteromonas sp. NBT06-2]PAJ71730.1 hypothetical protein CJF42_25155 [Pseudoalteromonas sp. NBT06-2]
MKSNTKVLIACLIASVLSGCASVKYQSSPPVTTNKATHEVGYSELLNQTNHTLMHLNENKDIFYQQNFGGGGVGVGLLLGPIGVAANIAAIKSNTEEDVEALKGKITIDPKDIFKKASEKGGLELSINTSNSISVSPYIYVSKTDDEQLLLGSAMIVETAAGQKENWIGKYMYQTPVKVSKESISDGVDDVEFKLFEKSLSKGFEELIALYMEDRKGALTTQNPITFVSDFVSPRFKVEMVGDLVPSKDARVNIRTVGAVYSLPENAVEVKIKKKKT